MGHERTGHVVILTCVDACWSKPGTAIPSCPGFVPRIARGPTSVGHSTPEDRCISSFEMSVAPATSLIKDGQRNCHRYNRLCSPSGSQNTGKNMRRSESVGITEVQAMLRLVAETAELWYDPSVQRRYTLESLCKMLPAKAGICFTFGDILMGGESA